MAWGEKDALERAKRAVGLEHVTDGNDAVGGVGAIAILIEPAELVAGQTKM